MRKGRGNPLVVGLVLAMASSACDRTAADDPDANSGADPILLQDDAGREVRLSAPPSRLVSLVPSATDIVVALGHASRLVGRTDYDLLPEVAALPSVGGGLGPSMELLLALEPDMVVRFRAESDPDTPRQLDAAGVAHLAVRPDRIEDVRRIIGLLGAMLEEDARADSLTTAMDEDLRRVRDRVRGLQRPNVVLLGGVPPTVAGPDTFLHELLVIAGGANAFSDLDQLYAPISLEEILRRDIDLILAPEATPIPAALSRIDVRRIPLEVLNPGLRVAASAATLAEVLHPDAFE